MNWNDILTIIKTHKRSLILANLIAVIATLFTVPTPLMMPLLIDEVILKKTGTLTHTIDLFIADANALTYVGMTLLLTVLLRFLFFVFSVLQTKEFTKISKNVTFHIRKKILTHLQYLSMNEYDKQKSGYVVSVLLTEVDTIDTFLSAGVSKFMISVLTIIGVSVVLLLIHWKLALFILILNPIVVMITTKFARNISRLKKEENTAYKAFTEALSETVELYSHIKTANREKVYIDNIKDKAENLRDRSIQFGYKSDAYGRFSYFFFLSGFEVFRAASIMTVIYSDLSIGLMFAIFGYLWVMMGPVQDILNMQYSFANASRALERINEFLALERETQHKHEQNPFVDVTTVDLALKDLHFAYGDKMVLDGVNLELKKGQKIAIAGASGVGKSTLAKVMVGFYKPLRGDILYDNISYTKIGNETIRENVVLVEQMPLLFNDTLRMNLTLGRDIADKRLIEVLEKVTLKNLLNELDEGLDTVLGKHGVKFSGGQRQRVAIARALLQNPRVIIFDESTSALDTQTELEVIDAIDELLEGKTAIIIAHRESTLKSADKIYTLQDGKLV